MATADINVIDDEVIERHKPPFLRRVRIRGYKSIAFCDVTLEPLTVLVGRNGSGKSNFLDALAFLRDVVLLGVVQAVHNHRGRPGILNVDSEDDSVSFDLEMGYEETRSGHQVGASYRISVSIPAKRPRACFNVRLLTQTPTGDILPRFDSKGAISGSAGLNEVPELFFGMAHSGFYNFSPENIRRLQEPTPGEVLGKDGSNLASVFREIAEKDRRWADRIGAYLNVIAPDVESVKPIRYGDYETLRFSLQHAPGGAAREFDAANMSDGTLRALAALVAATQIHLPFPSALVGIEEPETALHPAAMNALVDALDEATLRTQVLITTHSADLLDNPTIKPENVRVVQMIDGQTVIGPVDEASVEIVQRNLNTLGGLERDNLLELDLDDQDRQKKLQALKEESPT